MCGILGCALAGSGGMLRRDVEAALRRLFLLSESRGKEASGIAVRAEQAIYVHREARSGPCPYSHNNVRGDRRPLSRLRILRHERSPCTHRACFTSRRTACRESAQTTNPLYARTLFGVHNGIIVNVDELWSRHADLPHQYEVDTEVFLRLIDRSLEDGAGVAHAARGAFAEISGAASVAVLFKGIPQLLLATNTGSLYTLQDPACSVLFFASEATILRRLQQSPAVSRVMASSSVEQVAAGGGLWTSLSLPCAPTVSISRREVTRGIRMGALARARRHSRGRSCRQSGTPSMHEMRSSRDIPSHLV